MNQSRPQKSLTNRQHSAKVKPQTFAMGFRKSRGGIPATGPQGASRGIVLHKKSLTKKSSSVKMNSQPPALDLRKHRGGFSYATKNIILIDGENFTHNLIRNLKSQNLLRSRSGLSKLNIAHITYFAKNSVINYYSTMVRIPKKSPLFGKAQKITKWNAKWAPYIANQGVNIIKAGLLRVRDGKTCQECGAQSEILLEKGVDVRVAIDIISLSGKNHKTFILSSDTDLVPAIDRAVRLGHKVFYVAFPGEVVNSIARVASGVIVLENKQIKRAYKDTP